MADFLETNASRVNLDGAVRNIPGLLSGDGGATSTGTADVTLVWAPAK